MAEHVLVEIAQEKETLGLFDPSSNNCLDDARDFARHVVKVAMEAGLEEDGYFKTIKPHLLIENLNLTAWVAEQLPSINSKIQSVKDDTQELIQGNKKILALLMAQTSGPTDPFADESIQKTLNRLLSTQDARRRAAAKHLRRDPPDRQAAVRDLKQLAAEQDDGVAESAAKTAETHREIAALTYYSDGEEAVRALEKVVAYAPDDHVSRNQLGLLLKRLGRLEGARQAFEALLEMHAEDTVVRAVALGNLGVTAQVRGDLDGAEAYLKQSLALQKELGRKEGMANQLGNLGVIAQVRGDLDGAEAYHQESLTLDKELGRKEGMAKELGNLGLIAQVRGDLDGAEVYLKESLALNEELGRKEGMAIQLGNLGVIAQTRGDLDGAEAYHKQSLALNEELGRKEGMAASLGNLGVIAQTRGDLNEAEAYNQESQALHKELGHKEGMARNLVNLGNVAFDRGDRASACAFYRQAESLFAEIGMRRELEQARALIAERCPHDAPSE
ncbi:MAG: tetratricopeptide repeat protein [Pseudomonadota bacterium]